MTPLTYTLLRYGVTLALVCYLLVQARRPDKWVGKLFARAMNRSHQSMTDWGLRHIMIERQFKVLDIGCGGGATVRRMAASAADGAVYGIDYGEGSVAVSRELNSQLIEAGRVVIQKASVSQLPFPDDYFDLATAIETQYYWPDLAADMREILRALKPGGKLVVIAEMYKGGRHDWTKWPLMWLLRSSHLSESDHRNLFASAGYGNVGVITETNKGWICAMASKPAEKS
jgi:SAM-dependent methyltransferase